MAGRAVGLAMGVTILLESFVQWGAADAIRKGVFFDVEADFGFGRWRWRFEERPELLVDVPQGSVMQAAI